MLAVGLLLQIYDNVSDQEAAERSQFDLRWQVALGVPVGSRPFAKSTLQLFRSQLVLHQQAQGIFRRSLELARQAGYLRGRKMRAVLDTTVIFGRGAVEDTYNLIAEGISGRMVAIRGGKYSHSPLPEPDSKPRAIDIPKMYNVDRYRPIYTNRMGLPLLLGIPVDEDPSLLK